jgi:hypothetical protein
VKKKMTKVTYIFRGSKKKVVTYFFSPLSFFFSSFYRLLLSRFGAFRDKGNLTTRGVQKRDKKNRRIFSAAAKNQKKYLLTSLFFPFAFAPAPLGLLGKQILPSLPLTPAPASNSQ